MDLVHATSDSLCNLVRWAHSHGTICHLIPVLQQLGRGSDPHNAHATLATESGLRGNGVAAAVWGCGAGHAYHWPLGHQDESNTSTQGQERSRGGRLASKVAITGSCDLSCSDAPSEAEEFGRRLFEATVSDSSATDEDGDGGYEPRPSRKRGGGAPGEASRLSGGPGKKIKQEGTSADCYYTVANVASDPDDPRQAPSPPPDKAATHCPKPNADQEEALGESGNSEMEVLGGGGSTTDPADQTAVAGCHGDGARLFALLRAERRRNEQMMETISGLKQDKELLQHQLAKKTKLICDFLQDQLRPENRRPRSSNQMEPGNSQIPFADDGAFDSPGLFDSFEEAELPPLERHRTMKSKWSRDGENTRVRMKNVVGVIARYMAALQEFRRSVSMKVAFDRVGVDRNTISRTAAIAELSLAAPEVFHSLAPWDEREETLAHYALRCRQAMDDSTKAKIKAMKAQGDLLPIVSK